jgi:hypothetical protein
LLGLFLKPLHHRLFHLTLKSLARHNPRAAG